jgi:hypothetical protein
MVLNNSAQQSDKDRSGSELKNNKIEDLRFFAGSKAERDIGTQTNSISVFEKIFTNAIIRMKIRLPIKRSKKSKT